MKESSKNDNTRRHHKKKRQRHWNIKLATRYKICLRWMQTVERAEGYLTQSLQRNGQYKIITKFILRVDWKMVNAKIIYQTSQTPNKNIKKKRHRTTEDGFLVQLSAQHTAHIHGKRENSFGLFRIYKVKFVTYFAFCSIFFFFSLAFILAISERRFNYMVRKSKDKNNNNFIIIFSYVYCVRCAFNIVIILWFIVSAL